MKSNSQSTERNPAENLMIRKTLRTALAKYDSSTKTLGFRTKPIPQDIIALQTFEKECKAEQLNPGEWYQLANLLEKQLKEPIFNSLTTNVVIMAIQRLKRQGILNGLNPTVESQIKVLAANPHVAKALLLLEEKMLTPAIFEGIQTCINEEDAENILLRVTMIDVRLKSLTTKKDPLKSFYLYDLKDDAKQTTTYLPSDYNCPDLVNLLHRNITNANIIFMFFSKMTEMGITLNKEQLTAICNSLKIQNIERILKCLTDLQKLKDASWDHPRFKMSAEIVNLFVQQVDSCEKIFELMKTWDNYILNNPVSITWINKGLQKNNHDAALAILKDFKFTLDTDSIPILCNALSLIGAAKLKAVLTTMSEFVDRVNEQYPNDERCLLGFCKKIVTLTPAHLENYLQLISFLKPIIDIKYRWMDLFAAAPYINQIKNFLTQNNHLLHQYGVTEEVLKNAKQLTNITSILTMLRNFAVTRAELTDSWRGAEFALAVIKHPHAEAVKAILEKIAADPNRIGYGEGGKRFNTEKLNVIMSLANNNLNPTQIDNIAYCINILNRIDPGLITTQNINAILAKPDIFIKIKSILDQLVYLHHDGNDFTLVYLTQYMLNNIIRHIDLAAAATQEVNEASVYPYIFNYPRVINNDFFEVVRSLRGNHLLNSREMLDDIFSTPRIAETLQKLNQNRHNLRTHHLSAPLPWHHDTEFRIAVLQGNRWEYKEAIRKIKEDQEWQAELIKVFRRKTASNPMRDAAFSIVNSRLQGSIRDCLFGGGIKVKADSKPIDIVPAATVSSKPKPVKPFITMAATPIMIEEVSNVSASTGDNATATARTTDAKSGSTTLTTAATIFDLISYLHEEINKFKIVFGMRLKSGSDSKIANDNKLEKEINEILDAHDKEITKVSETTQPTETYDKHTGEMLVDRLQQVQAKIDSSLRAVAAEKRIKGEDPVVKERFTRYKAYSAIFNNRIKIQLELLQAKLGKNALRPY
jgi:hypothetical protein